MTVMTGNGGGWECASVGDDCDVSTSRVWSSTRKLRLMVRLSLSQTTDSSQLNVEAQQAAIVPTLQMALRRRPSLVSRACCSTQCGDVSRARVTMCR